MVMTGSNQATVVLSAVSPHTRLHVHYRCLHDDSLLFALNISPMWLALWMGIWLLLISMCCASACWLIRRRNARRSQVNVCKCSAGFVPGPC